MACRVRDIEQARTKSYQLIPPTIAHVADEAVARLDLKRMGKRLDEDTFDQRVALIQDSQPQFAQLLTAEKGRASLRTLLARVRMPVRPTMTADELRSAILDSMNWGQ